MKKTTIVVVDDHKMIRQMWVHLFAGNTAFEITGQSDSFTDAIEMIKLHRPDIILLDINLQDASGMDAVPLIRKFSPGSRIIAVSMHNQPAYVKKMLQLGARAYVTKNSSHDEIFKAIEAVMKGEIFLCAEIKDNIGLHFIKDQTSPHNTNELSMREIEIIKLLKTGLSSKEISLSLNISTRTVEVHRHNVLKKLELKNTASLISYIGTTDLCFN